MFVLGMLQVVAIIKDSSRGFNRRERVAKGRGGLAAQWNGGWSIAQHRLFLLFPAEAQSWQRSMERRPRIGGSSD
jgi:hypothetical protein